MGGRREVVEQFLIPELKEAVTNVSGDAGAAGPDPGPKGADGLGPVSYTHLTLPTIYSV